MDNYSEGLATGMALSDRNNNCYGVPYDYGMGGGLFGGNWGGDWIGLIILAALFGWGGFGGGFGFGGRGGNCATQADLSAGFANSEIMSDLNDIILQTSQGFAAVQQTLCQGFSGINATVNTVGNQINQGICNLGYTIQGGFNSLSHQISDCCCDIKTMNLENRYLNERQTCDIINAFNAGNQRLFDYFVAKENQDLRDKLQTANFQLSQINQNAFITANQEAQTAELIRRLGRDCPTPAFIVPNPNCCYNYNVNGIGYGNNGGCCNGGF